MIAVRWARFGTLGTPAQATEGGDNKGGDTVTRDNWQLLFNASRQLASTKKSLRGGIQRHSPSKLHLFGSVC